MKFGIRHSMIVTMNDDYSVPPNSRIIAFVDAKADFRRLLEMLAEVNTRSRLKAALDKIIEQGEPSDFAVNEAVAALEDANNEYNRIMDPSYAHPSKNDSRS